ncbi:MAG: prealbumin-like fold domain-containing protein [Eggerthia catenaformis]|uniref:prealbumin-like fold domain-containing protein n=1 Tax=Eggerthia catenaformis TaxID=31973 RepID=UPI003FA0C2B8
MKKIENKNIPIKVVEFILERKDNRDIEVKENNTFVNKGKSITLTTDKDGIANIKGLRAATYIMRENKAPNRIEFDVNDPIKKEFTVSDNDIEGKEIQDRKQKENYRYKCRKNIER